MFIYIDEASVSQRDQALVISVQDGKWELPMTKVAVIFLGPGTTITSKAIQLVASQDIPVIWTGQEGVRFYATGSPATKNARITIKQAELASNPEKRAKVARAMYGYRFPEEDVSKLSIQQLRGKEGTRVKRIYADTAKQYNSVWAGRNARIGNIEESDSINLPITLGTQCLYGIVHSVICAVGASPALGFIHHGNARAFVFDIADLYKTDLIVPFAFELVSRGEGISVNDAIVRKEIRDLFHREKLIVRIVEDIKNLLMIEPYVSGEEDPLALWDHNTTVAAYRSWDEDNDSNSS